MSPKKTSQKGTLGAQPDGSFPGTPEEVRKALRKAARKAAGQSLWAIAKGLILHYAVSLAAVAVIAYSGFSDVPRAALSATALGLLARWFLPNRATQAAFEKQPQFPVGQLELTPDELKEFFSKLGQDGAADAAPGPSPYM